MAHGDIPYTANHIGFVRLWCQIATDPVRQVVYLPDRAMIDVQGAFYSKPAAFRPSIGSIDAELAIIDLNRLATGHLVLFASVLIPFEFGLGLIEAAAKKFARPGQNPIVTHENP